MIYEKEEKYLENDLKLKEEYQQLEELEKHIHLMETQIKERDKENHLIDMKIKEYARNGKIEKAS